MNKPKEGQRLPKLTDVERHNRFLEVAKKVDASDKLEDLDRSLDKLAKPRISKPTSSLT
jgi:site-specific recombinase XerC